MKVDIPKDWCLNMAMKEEGDCCAGRLAAIPDTPKVLNPYPEIWLNVGDIECDCDISEIYREGDISWCVTQQYDADVRYVLASARDAEVEELKERVKELEQLIKTPIAWKYKIASYCDHAPASGVVLEKETMQNIPEKYISWEPVFIESATKALGE